MFNDQRARNTFEDHLYRLNLRTAASEDTMHVFGAPFLGPTSYSLPFPGRIPERTVYWERIAVPPVISNGGDLDRAFHETP